MDITHIKPPYIFDSNLIEKLQCIKVALFDVDGILTDGSLYYDGSGEVMKQFNVLDGQGLKLLQNNGIEVGIISAKQSKALTKRLDHLGIKHQLTGISDKLSAMTELLEKLNASAEHTCFTGDDVIDLAVMNACAVKFTVENGHYSVKALADWQSPLKGGQGAARSICDLILYAQNV